MWSTLIHKMCTPLYCSHGFYWQNAEPTTVYSKIVVSHVYDSHFLRPSAS